MVPVSTSRMKKTKGRSTVISTGATGAACSTSITLYSNLGLAEPWRWTRRRAVGGEWSPKRRERACPQCQRRQRSAICSSARPAGAVRACRDASSRLVSSGLCLLWSLRVFGPGEYFTGPSPPRNTVSLCAVHRVFGGSQVLYTVCAALVGNTSFPSAVARNPDLILWTPVNRMRGWQPPNLTLPAFAAV